MDVRINRIINACYIEGDGYVATCLFSYYLGYRQDIDGSSFLL